MRGPFAALAGALLLLAPLEAEAALIAHWTFDGGLPLDVSGSPTAYDLSTVGGGPDVSLGFAAFDGDDASPSYLEVAGPGWAPSFTVSLWVRSQGSIDQGNYQGIFSNNSASGADYSWQIESFAGMYQWRTDAGVVTIGAPSALGEWDHIVVRKTGSNDGDVWLNGVQVVSSLGGNPGGLQFFRLGTNRNTNRLWQGDLEDVRVYRDELVDPTVLYAAPPAAVAEPTLALLLVGALVPTLRRGD